jgi:hypothetical protein
MVHMRFMSVRILRIQTESLVRTALAWKLKAGFALWLRSTLRMKSRCPDRGSRIQLCGPKHAAIHMSALDHRESAFANLATIATLQPLSALGISSRAAASLIVERNRVCVRAAQRRGVKCGRKPNQFRARSARTQTTPSGERSW